MSLFPPPCCPPTLPQVCAAISHCLVLHRAPSQRPAGPGAPELWRGPQSCGSATQPGCSPCVGVSGSSETWWDDTSPQDAEEDHLGSHCEPSAAGECPLEACACVCWQHVRVPLSSLSVCFQCYKTGLMSQYVESWRAGDTAFWRGPFGDFFYKPNQVSASSLNGERSPPFRQGCG